MAHARGRSSAAEHQLPKLRTRVRFPSPALVSRIRARARRRCRRRAAGSRRRGGDDRETVAGQGHPGAGLGPAWGRPPGWVPARREAPRTGRPRRIPHGRRRQTWPLGSKGAQLVEPGHRVSTDRAPPIRSATAPSGTPERGTRRGSHASDGSWSKAQQLLGSPGRPVATVSTCGGWRRVRRGWRSWWQRCSYSLHVGARAAAILAGHARHRQSARHSAARCPPSTGSSSTGAMPSPRTTCASRSLTR